LSLDGGGLLDQVANDGDPRLNGPGRAAGLLDGQGAQGRTGGQALVLQPGRDLVGFAAQTDDQDGGEVGVIGIASQRPLQDGDIGAER
jgi:hypothetical protein